MLLAEGILTIERVVKDDDAMGLVGIVFKLGKKERQAKVLLSPELRVFRKLGSFTRFWRRPIPPPHR